MGASVETQVAEGVPEIIDPDFDSMGGITREEPAAATPASESGDPASGEKGEPGQPAQGQAEESGQATAQPAATPQQPQTFKIRGKDYTPEQIAADPRLLGDLVASYGKLPNISRADSEKAERIRQLEQQLSGRTQQAPAPGQQQPQVQPGSAGLSRFTPAQVTAAVAHVVGAAVKEGWIEKEMAEVFPNFSAQAVVHRDLIYDVRAATAELQARIAQLESREVTDNTRVEWEGVLDGLASQGEWFDPLKDKTGEARQAFEKYMVETFGHFPRERVLQPEFIGKQWLAFNADPITAALKAAGDASRARTERQRANAAGTAGGGRTGSPQADSGDFDPDLIPEGHRWKRRSA